MINHLVCGIIFAAPVLVLCEAEVVCFRPAILHFQYQNSSFYLKVKSFITSDPTKKQKLQLQTHNGIVNMRLSI